MTTALEMISSAMRLANILGEGQQPSGDQSSQALAVLNEMLDSWGIDSLMLYRTPSTQVTLTPGQATYTIGTGGQLNVERPAEISSMYVDYQGISFPMYEVNQDEYNLITLKTLNQTFPRFFLYVNDYPFGRLTVWPTPMNANALTFSADRVLSNIPTVGTTLVLPPGYAKAVRYNLAMELCPEYGKEPSPSLARTAKESKADIKRANHVPVVSEFDPALTGTAGGLAGFLSGY
jgi:hypothetical protein